MNVALFGGTFDPIHCGHLAAARAARDRFLLDRIHFIPSGRPPHRRGQLSDFDHRYAMVALACAGEPGFIASLAEAPSGRAVNYSVHTVRRFRRMLAKGDRLFFIIGADAFLEFRTWKQWRTLLDAAEFIVVSRPGFTLDHVRRVLPSGLASEPSLLPDVAEPASATEVRRLARAGRDLRGLVPPTVAEYIFKQGLYR